MACCLPSGRGYPAAEDSPLITTTHVACQPWLNFDLEVAPVVPQASALALTRESYGLWLDAVEQYQIEGTALFNAVRPSLPLTGAYTQMDVRAISQMKSETSAVKDGRALLRWALDFVNKSSLSCQMQLLEELNKKKINSQADMFQFSDHMVSLYEMWLQKEGSKVDEPADYFQRLLASIPFEHAGPFLLVFATRRQT